MAGITAGNPQCVQAHSVYIFDRGGQNRMFQLVDLSSVKWGRRRDDVSEATVIIEGSACSEQAEWLSQIEPKRHEMVIFRGTERVWEGPVWRVGWHRTKVEIVAHDVFEYLRGRPLSRIWDNTYTKNGATKVITDNRTTVVSRADQIARWELANPFSYKKGNNQTVTIPAWESLTPPANVLPFLKAHKYVDDAMTATYTSPFQMSVGEHLDNLAQRSGLDYTTVGRAIHFWDVHRSLGRGKTLTDADFENEVIVTAYGASHAEVAFVVSEQDSRYGGYGEGSSFYGPWTKMFTVYDEDESDPPTQADLNSQAQRNLNGRTPVPVQVRVPENSTIRLSESLTIHDLVPGIRFPLSATLNARKLTQMVKLHTVDVSETGSEGEKITVTLVSADQDDDDTAEEMA